MFTTQKHLIPNPIAAVELAKQSDASEIFDIIKDSYKKDFFRYPNRPRSSLEKVNAYFNNPYYSWYVIKMPKNNDENEIAGVFLYSSDAAPESLAEGNIHMLAVHSKYWGQKLSKPLIQAAERRAVQENKKNINLIVMNTNPKLIELYKKYGYFFTGKKYVMPDYAIQPQFHFRDSEGKLLICALHMEKTLIT